MRDLRHGVENCRHLVEALLRYGQSRQGEGASEPLDIEHRTEAGQRAVVEQRLHACAQRLGTAAKLLGQRLPRLPYQWQTMLQAVDQLAVEIIHAQPL
ncbi:hypothetical protein D3C77_643080 [compost metagenome]